MDVTGTTTFAYGQLDQAHEINKVKLETETERIHLFTSYYYLVKFFTMVMMIAIITTLS